MKLILTILAVILAAPVAAQTKCALTQGIEQRLIMRFGESVVETRDVASPENPGYIINFRIWANAETGSWSLTGTRDDVTCIYAGSIGGYAGQLLDDFLNPEVEPSGLKL